MFGGLNRLSVAAVIAVVVFAVPPAAFACNNGVSAVNVYKECLPSGGGGKPTGGGHPSRATHTSRGTNTSGGGPATSPVVSIPKHTVKALKKAGKEGKSLSTLVRHYGTARVLTASHSPASPPTAMSSAFDLGSGPTALLIVLAGTAVLLLAASGFRLTRKRS